MSILYREQEQDVCGSMRPLDLSEPKLPGSLGAPKQISMVKETQSNLDRAIHRLDIAVSALQEKLSEVLPPVYPNRGSGCSNEAKEAIPDSPLNAYLKQKTHEVEAITDFVEDLLRNLQV